MEKWDYKYENFIPTYWSTQTDWNQTLMTKFNMLSAGVNSAIVIKVPNKFKPLIESLEFYCPSTKKIGVRFSVEFIDSDDNIIHVGDSELEIQNFNDLNEELLKSNG